MMGFMNKLKTIFSFDEEFEYEYVEEEEDLSVAKGNQQEEKNVVNLASMKQPTSKVVLCEPRTYNEVQEIADQIVNRRAVVINLERVDNQEARRIIDFLSGTIYAVEGEIQKLGTQTFLCAPDNIEISGSISERYSDHELNKGW